MKKLILCGYMGSGKTTIARLLAKSTGLTYIDLDEVIEQKTGKTISQLFEEGGEIKFRKLEHQCLNEVVNGSGGFVLSLGGGTPSYANNHEVLKRDDVASVYLKASIGELIRRIKKQPGLRPLLEGQKEDEMEEFIAKHLFDRSYYYHQAKYIIATDGKTPEAITDEIMNLV